MTHPPTTEPERGAASEALTTTVREKYGEAARRVLEAGSAASCCGQVNSCCGGAAFNGSTDPITSNLYVSGETDELPPAAVLASLGCGNPTALAELHPGEVVLDLGSGGGIDVILSARRVAPTGKAYGLDMTDDMLALARRNASEAGVTNVEVLRGRIEEIPLPDDSVDVIISNCVINLSGDKRRVLAEAFRVLRPGGRFAVSDVVVRGEVPPAVRRSMELWVGCVAGALGEAEFRALLAEAGFEGAEIEPTRVYRSEDARLFLEGAGIAVDEHLDQIDGRFMAAFVRATKPTATAPPLTPRHEPASGPPSSVVQRLSVLDRFLPLWIFAAMALGLLLGRAAPGIGAVLDRVKVAGVSVPIGVGLLWMMYPVLARVRYETLGRHLGDTKLLGTSLFLNWVLGPVVMFTLAWVFLPDLPAYRNGLVLIGLARCIAMVLIWNSLARGSGELAAVLVALNSVFQILTYSVLGWLFLSVVPGWLGATTAAVPVSMWMIAKSVLIFLGIPLLAGYLTRRTLVARRGEAWYTGTFMPRFGPTALVGLLYTIVLMFAMQGSRVLGLPLDVLRIAMPLLAYFAVMFGLAFALSAKLGFGYEETTALSFTAAGNNFELAIAVAVATFGIGSGEALAAVVGPLIEVPTLIGLVYVSLWARRQFFSTDVRRGSGRAAGC